MIPGLEREIAPEQARTIRFTLSGLVIEGVTAYSQAEFALLYENLLAQEVSLADIYAIADKITKKYAADGYLLFQAVVPGQQVELGIIRIRVNEGYLENIVFEGKVEGTPSLLETYAAKITESQPLRAAVLERLYPADERPA